jgi:ATP synthase F1 epsilon subunit
LNKNFNLYSKLIFLFKKIINRFSIMSLQVCIMTPARVFWNEEAEELILPTNTGQMGVLSNHAPLITALDIGAMMVRTKQEWRAVALMGGFALVKNNQVTILVNEAEASSTIDPREAEKAFEEAKTRLEQAQGEKEKVEATFTFKRARARYQIVQSKG